MADTSKIVLTSAGFPSVHAFVAAPVSSPLTGARPKDWWESRMSEEQGVPTLLEEGLGGLVTRFQVGDCVGVSTGSRLQLGEIKVGRHQEAMNASCRFLNGDLPT